MPHAKLATLREEIAEVDRALLELLRRRMELAAAVGSVKAESGAAVVVRDVEDHVLSRARQHAEACGVSEEVMASIFQAIMRGSVERQHRVGVARRVARGGRTLIVGGSGSMGGWLRGFIELVGNRVDVVDPAVGPVPPCEGRYVSLGDVPDLDVYQAIWIAVPLARTQQVIDELTALSPRALVVEIASIKGHLQEPLERAAKAGVEVASLHPMFGPSKSPYESLTFVLACRSLPENERARMEALLRHPYTRLVAIPFAHHDRLMGWLLGLAHLTGMLFGQALTDSGLDPEELMSCASTTFARQAATASSVLANDPDLYLDIQRLNPYRDQVYEATRGALERLEALVRAGDREGFREALTDARRALGEGT